ncbi:MAG: HAD family hydrolase [Ktedonobacteraceae bacterium]|nr:HAD family hydrolase [Ktedonobacteraceae bacterium]
MKALIFDFDGLILDTEVSELQSWREIYAEYDAALPLEQWAACIGSGSDSFDPCAYLEAQVGHPIERKDILARRRKRRLELLAAEVVLPGVEAYLRDAKRLGLKPGLASSSSRDWVYGHLSRLGIADSFDCIKCGDEVTHKKPDPELYLSVLSCLEVPAEQAVALEDSPNGVLAAQRAGIFCVAIPNPVTSQLDLAHADLRLQSLALMPLEDLIAEVEKRRNTSPAR